MPEDPYAVLGLPSDATAAQIAQARRRLSRELHPDVNHAPDAEARFEAVQEAFDLLSDPAARAEHDRRAGHQGPPAGADRQGPGRGANPRRGAARPGGQATEVAPGIFVQPTTVNFGLLHPGRPRAYAKVTVAWTGDRPARISSGVHGEWWRSMHAESPASGSMVFSLCAERKPGGPAGPQDGQFTVTLDDKSVRVHLVAVFLDVAPGAPVSRPGTGKRDWRAWLRRTR